MAALGSAARFFSLQPSDLELSDSYKAAGTLYDGEAMSVIRRAVANKFSGPVFYVVEVGEPKPNRRGRLNLHVVAHRDDGPAHIPRESQRCKPVYNPEGLWFYLNKPPEAWSIAAELDYKAACVLAPKGCAPKTRAYLYSAARAAWVAEQGTYCSYSAVLFPAPLPALPNPSLNPGTGMSKGEAKPPVEATPTTPEPGTRKGKPSDRELELVGGIRQLEALERPENGPKLPVLAVLSGTQETPFSKRKTSLNGRRKCGRNRTQRTLQGAVSPVLSNLKRRKLEATGEIPLLDKLTGRDGKTRPRALSPPKPP